MAKTRSGRELATDLVDGDDRLRTRALGQLRDAPPQVSNAAARRLAKILRQGGTRARAAADVLFDRKGPRFGEYAHARLSIALHEVGAIDPQAGTQHSFQTRGRDGQYWRKLQDSRPPGNPHPVARVLSVARSWWTWPLLGMAFAIFVPSIVDGGAGRTIGLGVLGGMAGVMLVVDAIRRRCPRCRKLLGADLLTRVRKDRNHPPTSTFRCAHCRHKWSRSTWF